jgi:hypothetical protein
MSQIAEIFGNPLIAFFLGLTPAIITSAVTIVLYHKKGINVKEKELCQPILRLYDLVSKIMEEDNALDLRKNYHKLELTNDEWRALTKKNLVFGRQPATKEEIEECFGNMLVDSMNFSKSRLCAIRLVDKCLAFEEEYNKMDNDGLISLLKKRHYSAFTEISTFEYGVKGVLFITEKARTNRAANPQEGEQPSTETILNIQVDEYLDSLFKIQSVGTELFSIAPDVQKRLSKFL